METFTSRKLMCLVTAISLAFFQVVPVSFGYQPVAAVDAAGKDQQAPTVEATPSDQEQAPVTEKSLAVSSNQGTSMDFLQDANPLSPSVIPESSEQSVEEATGLNADTEVQISQNSEVQVTDSPDSSRLGRPVNNDEIGLDVEVPPAVRQYTEELKKILGDDFLVGVKAFAMGIKCEEGKPCDNIRYSVFIERNPKSERPVSIGDLQTMSFGISKEGEPYLDSLQVTYEGFQIPDAQLLFAAMTACPQGQMCTMQMTRPLDAFKKLSEIKVTGVEDGTIRYSLNGVNYKTYRDKEGNVVLEIERGMVPLSEPPVPLPIGIDKVDDPNEVPPEVQTYVEELQKLVGSGYIVSASRVNGVFQIDVRFNDQLGASIEEGQLKSLNFNLKEDRGVCTQGIPVVCYPSKFSIEPNSLNAVYAGRDGVDTKLLFEGMKLLPNGASDEEALALMTQIVISKVDADGAIHFSLDDISYKAYRDAENNVILEREIPPEVLTYVEQIQKAMPDYRVSVAFEDGAFKVSLALADTFDKPYPQGQLMSMSFNLLEEAKVCMDGRCSSSYQIDPDTLKATYATEVDGKLLFEGMKTLLNAELCSPSGACLERFITDINVLEAMANIKVSKVDENGAIHFERNGKYYKVSRDEQGNVKLEEEPSPAAQKAIEDLASRLGLTEEQAKAIVVVSEGWEGYSNGCANRARPDSICTMALVGGTGIRLKLYQNEFHYFNGQIDLTSEVALIAMKHLLQQGTVEDETIRLENVVIGQVILGNQYGYDLVKLKDGNFLWEYQISAVNGEILAVSRTEDVSPEVQAITAVVSTELIKAFGFTKEAFDQLVKDGKIVINVDVERLTANVTIDPSVKPVGGVDQGNLANLLGLSELPGQITFNLGVSYPPQQMGPLSMRPCTLDGGCPPVIPPVYYFKDGNFKIGGLDYNLFYAPEGGDVFFSDNYLGDSLLRAVVVSQPPIVGNGPTKLIETLTYVYPSEDDGTFTVEIVRPDVPEGGIAKRIVSIKQMNDGADHIQSIQEKDAQGNVVANNEFVYAISQPYCDPSAGGPCGSVTLARIVRTDASGKPLSEITIDQEGALIKLPDGSSKQVTYDSLEQLLDLAREFEASKNEYPPAVQAFVDELQKRAGDRYKVGVVFSEGGYRVTVSHSANDFRSGELETLSFTLSADGKVDVATLRATYPSFMMDQEIFAPDPELLFEALKLGGASDLDVLGQMIRLVVNNVEKDGTIHFTSENGQMWKVSRGVDGQPTLAEEYPPAVQAYVDDLQKLVGERYKVSVSFTENGVYKINIMRSEDKPFFLPGQLVSINYALRSETACTDSVPSSCRTFFEMDTSSLQVAYFGQTSTDAKLLFDGLMQLQSGCVSGKPCLDVARISDPRLAILVMTQITVGNVDADGAIHFKTENGQFWKVSRDPKTNQVILTEEYPPAVQTYVDSLQNQVGDRYKVSVSFIENGRYEISVVLQPTGVRPQGGDFLSTLKINISTAGEIDLKSLKATYASEVDAQLLFEGMKLLNSGASDQEALTLMAKIIVSKVDADGAIHFSKDDNYYKAYRNDQGEVMLEQEIPPVVQKYADDLQKMLGEGFLVNVRMDRILSKIVCAGGAPCPDRMSYSVVITRSGGVATDVDSVLQNVDTLPVATLGGGEFRSMSFGISKEGEPDWTSLEANYGAGDEMPDAQLLFAGLMQLQSGCISGKPCLDVAKLSDPRKAIVDMTQIVVDSVDADGAIHFEKDGKYYKVYRDEQQNVRLEEEPSPAERAVIAVVAAELMNAFGFTREAFDQWVKDGKIAIKVDLEKMTAIVTIDPSVQLVRGVDQGNLANLLGLSQLPGQITYNLGVTIPPQPMGPQSTGPCVLNSDGTASCPPVVPPVYFLQEGNFSIGGLSYKLSYVPEGEIISDIYAGDNRLRAVVVSQGPICTGSVCPASVFPTKEIKKMTFVYSSEGDAAFTVEILHLVTTVGGITKRVVAIKKMEDGAYHLQTIEDQDAKGNVVAKNEFIYAISDPYCNPSAGGPCGSTTLVHILRTDLNGKPLSKINVEGNIAVITLESGRTWKGVYSSLEHLLDLAWQFENGVELDAQWNSAGLFRLPPLENSYLEDEKRAQEASGSLTALRLAANYYRRRPVMTSRRAFSSTSLTPVSEALRESAFPLGGQGYGETQIFDFEKGNILFSKLLTELTK